MAGGPFQRGSNITRVPHFSRVSRTGPLLPQTAILLLPRRLRPIFNFQPLNPPKRAIVGSENRVQRKRVSANHDIEVPHGLTLAFERSSKLAVLLGCV